MIGPIAIVTLTAGTWYALKQAAATFDRPGLWDRADILAGVVGMVALVVNAWPHYLYQTDGTLLLFLDAIVFGTGVVIMGIFLSVMAERENMIRRPADLAAPPVRAFKNAAVADEDIRREFPAEMWDHGEWQAAVGSDRGESQ